MSSRDDQRHVFRFAGDHVSNCIFARANCTVVYPINYTRWPVANATTTIPAGISLSGSAAAVKVSGTMQSTDSTVAHWQCILLVASPAPLSTLNIDFRPGCYFTTVGRPGWHSASWLEGLPRLTLSCRCRPVGHSHCLAYPKPTLIDGDVAINWIKRAISSW